MYKVTIQEISEAIKDVLKTMAQIDVEVQSVESDDSIHTNQTFIWVEIVLRGTSESQYLIGGFSKPFANSILGRMIEIKDEFSDNEITDSLVEIINMIGGHYKSSCNRQNIVFHEMSIPQLKFNNEIHEFLKNKFPLVSLKIDSIYGAGKLDIYQAGV